MGVSKHNLRVKVTISRAENEFVRQEAKKRDVSISVYMADAVRERLRRDGVFLAEQESK